jgi:hypothetical protein
VAGIGTTIITSAAAGNGPASGEPLNDRRLSFRQELFPRNADFIS